MASPEACGRLFILEMDPDHLDTVMANGGTVSCREPVPPNSLHEASETAGLAQLYQAKRKCRAHRTSMSRFGAPLAHRGSDSDSGVGVLTGKCGGTGSLEIAVAKRVNPMTLASSSAVVECTRSCSRVRRSHRDLGLENRWRAPALGRGDAMRAQLGGKEVGGDENYLLANVDDGGGHVCGRDRKEVEREVPAKPALL